MNPLAAAFLPVLTVEELGWMSWVGACLDPYLDPCYEETGSKKYLLSRKDRRKFVWTKS